MKVLVTGSTGFVGSHLSEKFSELGHEVFSLARNPKKFDEFNVSGKMISGTLSPQLENSWIDELPDDLDAVIHTAGIVQSFDWSEFYRVNTQATERLITDLKKRYPKKLKFVLISSLAAGGPAKSDKKRKEHHSSDPVSHYGHSKRFAEISLEHLAPLGWDKIIIRPPMVIGPRDQGVLEIFKMVKNGFVLVAGLNGLDKKYSFVCVHDLVNVVVHGLAKSLDPGHPELYYATHPQSFSFREIIETIRTSAKKKKLFFLVTPMFLLSGLACLLYWIQKMIPLSVPLTPDKIKEIEPAAWLCCHEKSCEKLEFEYQWNLQRTIDITLEDYQSRKWL